MAKVKKGFASLAALKLELLPEVEVEKVSEPSLKDRQALAIAKAKELYAVPDTATIRVYEEEVSISIKELIAPIPQTFAEWETTQWVEQTRYITVKFTSDDDVREHWESVHQDRAYRPSLKEEQLPLFFPEYFFEDGEVFTVFRGMKCRVSEPSQPRMLARNNREEFLGFSSVPTIQVYLSSVDVNEYGKREVCRYCDIDLIGYSTESIGSSNGCTTSRDSDGMWNK